MGKVFNVTADCKPGEHYMVNLDGRLSEVKELVDAGKYFTINRARQYGKTTMLRALRRYLQDEYYVVLMDFQTFGNAKFKDEHTFSISFAASFLRLLGRNNLVMPEKMEQAVLTLKRFVAEKPEGFEQKELFENLGEICAASDKQIVLMIDEVDSAANNQVFLDFLSQLRACYIDRDIQPTFRSVILASVYDIKNLKRKLRPEDDHKVNSPWNIAAEFNVEMSFSIEDILGMLKEYVADRHIDMNFNEIAGLIHDYTSGYPFLVSKLCKMMDEGIPGSEKICSRREAWTREGVQEAVRIILSEKNTLFESMIGKLNDYPELNEMLKALLFTGKSIAYNADDPAVDMAEMFGFIRSQQGVIVIANRIFETRLYNLYLSTAKMQGEKIYKASLQDKNQFVIDGHLNMRRILERFVIHFNELYHDSTEPFIEEVGRKYFLLYLRPIINGTGNYYIESRTRNLRRTDVIVDYNGEQHVVEMKIWRGNEYHTRGEEQLVGYLDDYHTKKGYLISFNFNKKKKSGVHELVVGDKVLVEAVV
jgi:Predicted AAA-ATPase.